MSIRLVLAGAGGFGRGVFAWVRSSPEYLRRNCVREVVVIDDGTQGDQEPLPVVDSIANFVPRDDDRVICAIGSPFVRRKVVDRLSAAGVIFTSFVDDRAILGDRVAIGAGVIVCPGSVLSSDVKLDDHVHVNFNCSIGHDVKFGEYSTLSPAVNVMGEVICGEASFLGGGSTVLPRLTVGKGVVIGAGAVVAKDVPDWATVVGVPAG